MTPTTSTASLRFLACASCTDKTAQFYRLLSRSSSLRTRSAMQYGRHGRCAVDACRQQFAIHGSARACPLAAALRGEGTPLETHACALAQLDEGVLVHRTAGIEITPFTSFGSTDQLATEQTARGKPASAATAKGARKESTRPLNPLSSAIPLSCELPR